MMKINNREIGPLYEPYIIAEISANHNGDINNAYALIKMAKECGANAVKLQTYKPDTITIDCDKPDFMIDGGLWHGQSLYQLYESAFLPWEWHEPLFNYARKIGITIFSSPFDKTAVDLLEELNAPAYKIASFEAIDLPLIEYVASKGKPLIISTGMANKEEIQEAIDAAHNVGCKELSILHCVSGYPAPPEDYNLKTIKDMMKRFHLPVGLSDHTLDNTTAIASVVLGGCIIEKHITLNRSAGGPDDSFSLEKEGLRELCDGALTAWRSLGKVDYTRKSSEVGNVQFRRSLYFVQDIKSDEVITENHVRSIRPGFGIAPKYLNDIIGKRAARNISLGTPVSEDLYN